MWAGLEGRRGRKPARMSALGRRTFVENVSLDQVELNLGIIHNGIEVTN